MHLRDLYYILRITLLWHGPCQARIMPPTCRIGYEAPLHVGGCGPGGPHLALKIPKRFQ